MGTYLTLTTPETNSDIARHSNQAQTYSNQVFESPIALLHQIKMPSHLRLQSSIEEPIYVPHSNLLRRLHGKVQARKGSQQGRPQPQVARWPCKSPWPAYGRPCRCREGARSLVQPDSPEGF